MCISWKLFWKSLRIILRSTYSTAVDLNEVPQTVHVWLYAATITISQVSRKISYQLTFCQHVPSKFDFKQNLFNLWFSQLQGQFSKVTRKQSRVLQGWLQQWEATHPLVVQYLAGKSSSSLHAVERGHLSLHCRDDIYTCASLDIKNMIYIYWHFLVYTAVCSLVSLSTYSFSYPYIHLLIWTSIECLYAHMHMWNHMENE